MFLRTKHPRRCSVLDTLQLLIKFMPSGNGTKWRPTVESVKEDSISLHEEYVLSSIVNSGSNHFLQHVRYHISFSKFLSDAGRSIVAVAGEFSVTVVLPIALFSTLLISFMILRIRSRRSPHLHNEYVRLATKRLPPASRTASTRPGRTQWSELLLINEA